MIEVTIGREALLSNLYRQISSFWGIDGKEKLLIEDNLDVVLARCEINLSAVQNKYIVNGLGGVKLNPFHSVQYMILLYYLSNTLYKNGKGGQLSDKLYYLNKTMNGVDMFYAIEMPEHFFAEHPVGSVMGRGKFSDGFFFYQGCTVGGTKDRNGIISYPELGENVHMFANSSILGKCKIGNNVNIGAGAIVKNQDVPDNCIVFGESPHLIIKASSND